MLTPGVYSKLCHANIMDFLPDPSLEVLALLTGDHVSLATRSMLVYDIPSCSVTEYSLNKCIMGPKLSMSIHPQ
jgi:hypothetical protein